MFFIKFIDVIAYYQVCFSGVFDKVKDKGKRALLKFRAKHIADHEALHQFYWFDDPEPKYIYYTYHSKKSEEWYKSIKGDDQLAMYEDLEEKSTSKYINSFKKLSFDEVSIWKFKNEKVGKDKTDETDETMGKSANDKKVEKDQEDIKDEKGKSANVKKVKKDRKAIEKEIKELYSKIGDLLNQLDIQE